GLDPRLSALARGEIIDRLTVEPVADADLDGLETVEDVELRERDAVDAGGAHGLAHEGGVEPAAAALAARNHPELLALLPDELAGLVEQLGRERPLAHPGRISLGDAEHVVDGAGPEARTRGGL